MSTKTARYKALVEKRKACKACQGLTNPSVVDSGAFDSSEIGPWTTWQGNLDAPVVVVGQDWGDVAYFTKWQGNDLLAGNPTNKNLQQLLKQLGIAIQLTNSKQDQQIFLTNLILCLKDGGLQAPITKEWCSNCATRFLKELLEIIQPTLVITLGAMPARAALDLFQVKYRRSWSLKRLMQTAPFLLFNNTWLYPVYHCGNSSINRNRSYVEQEADWQQAATYYKRLTDSAPKTSEPISVLVAALENNDIDLLGRYPFTQLPDECLTPGSVPSNPSWDEPSVAQCFALMFDGYSWSEQNSVNLEELYNDALTDWHENRLDRFSISELRAVLFTLQRSYHDSWEQPDSEFVTALLEAIKRKV